MNILPDCTVNLKNIEADSSTDDVLFWAWVHCPSRTSRFSGVKISFTWNDQGWGNRKGHVYARAPGGAWCRVTSAPAPHARTTCSFMIPARALIGSSVQLGYVVGGGGGHQLYISNAKADVNGAMSSDRPPQPPSPSPSPQPPVPAPAEDSTAAVSPTTRAVTLPPDFIPPNLRMRLMQGHAAASFRTLTLADVDSQTGILEAGKTQLVWFPLYQGDRVPQEGGRFVYWNPVNHAKKGTYPAWVVPGVRLTYTSKHATRWLQMRLASFSQQHPQYFFMPMHDLLLPVGPSAAAPQEWVGSGDDGDVDDAGGAAESPLATASSVQQLLRSAVEEEAKERFGECPSKSRPTLGLLRGVMDGGVGDKEKKHSKAAAARALYRCYGSGELALEWLRAKEGEA